MLDVDIVVFSMGTWYNWKRIHKKDFDTTENYTSLMCPKLKSVKLDYKALLSYSYERRHKCPGTMNFRSYMSDLRRFGNAFARIGRELGAKMPRVVWKSAAPQHFDTPSGMCDAIDLAWRGKCGNRRGCFPIQNLTSAYERNTVAEIIFDPLLTASNGTLRLVYWNHWDKEWPFAGSHLSEKDCTHFCLTSDVPVSWVSGLVQALL